MPKNLKVKRALNLIHTLFVSLFLLSFVFQAANVRSAVLIDGSLTMSDPRINQSNVTYTFDWAGFSTGTALQCIQIEFSTAADNSGGNPPGLSSTSATFTSSSLITSGNWSLNNVTNGTLTLTHNTASETPLTTGNLVFDGLVNGENSTSYFAKIFTYSDSGCTTEVDSGIIAYTYTDGQLVTLTVDPSITFTIDPVATTQPVNGADTNIATTDGTIPFGTLTASSNRIGAHDLTISTNALKGYDVSVKYTGPLTYSASATIDDHTGTNGTPTTFPAAGTEAFGYTTESPSASFASNTWAGFTTNFETVATSANSGTELFRVGYQVGIALTTEAGTYSTTIVYQATPTY